MKDFTILESGFPEWSWESSNGEASAIDTAVAYYAITNQGDVYSFGHNVWNDIVSLLERALTESGIGWDAKYCTAEEAKVYGEFGILTAKAFNSLRHNISVMNTTWRWTDNSSIKGYTGRLDFKGYTDVGSNADLLYGNYIVELVEKLNTLISILADTMNKSLLSSPTDAAITSVAKLLEGIPTFITLHENLLFYINNASLELADKTDFNTHIHSEFNQSASIESHFGVDAIANAYSRLYPSATLETGYDCISKIISYTERSTADAGMRLWAVPLRLEPTRLYIRQAYYINKTGNELEVQ